MSSQANFTGPSFVLTEVSVTPTSIVVTFNYPPNVGTGSFSLISNTGINIGITQSATSNPYQINLALSQALSQGTWTLAYSGVTSGSLTVIAGTYQFVFGQPNANLAPLVSQTQSFNIVGAYVIDNYHIRLKFNSTVNAFSTSNFFIQGVTVQGVQNDPLDSKSLIISTSLLSPGTYSVITSGLFTGAPPIGMSPPYSAEFIIFVSSSENSTPTNAYTYLTKFLPPSFSGTNWSQLMGVLSEESQNSWDQSNSIYDQLFLITAEGKYLDQRASELGGYSRPDGVGFSDSDFRNLLVQLSSNQLTNNSILGILDIYYDKDSLNAHTVSSVFEPYNLSSYGPLAFSFSIDGNQTANFTLDPSEFEDITSVKSIELAVAINNQFQNLGIGAFAVPYFYQVYNIAGSNTPITYVAVYTNTRGISGSVKCYYSPLYFPVRNQTIQSQSTPAYILSNNGSVYISLPATSPVVNRTPNLDAAYLNDNQTYIANPSIQGSTVVLPYNSNISVGQWVILSGAVSPKSSVSGTPHGGPGNGLMAVIESNSISGTVLSNPSAVADNNVNLVNGSYEVVTALANGGGPYSTDPTQNFELSGINSSLASPIGPGSQSNYIQVGSNAGFPNNGYIVINYGYSNQLGPIPYSSLIGTTYLKIDPTFTISSVIGTGRVDLVVYSNDSNINDTGDEGFWATSSPSGRVAAQDNIDSIVSGGASVTYNIAYPGDYGLGAAGSPTHGVPRLSGVVAMFASDNIDSEIELARIS